MHSRPSDQRRSHGERPTAERAATMSWYDEMVATGRSKSLTNGNVRCGGAAVHEVLGSLAFETPVNCHSELMEDSLRNIEPVQLGVEQMCQASAELPSITDDTGCRIQQTLKLVGESHLRCGTFLPNLGTLDPWVLELFAMYATDGQTNRRTDKSNAYPYRRGIIIRKLITRAMSE